MGCASSIVVPTNDFEQLIEHYNSQSVEKLKISLKNNHSDIDLFVEWDNVFIMIPIQLN